LFLKDNTIFHDINLTGTSRFIPIWISVVLFLLMLGCSSIKIESGRNGQATSQNSTPENLFNVSGQIVTDQQIRSVQLFKNNNPDSPPIIELNSSDKLHLRFDYMDVSSKQFVITFSHHNIDWSPSSLAPSDITQGIRRIYMNTGIVNSNERPIYRSFSAVLPNEQVTFLRSGNYMLRVEDADTGFLVMSLPFFIFENEGSIESSVEFLQSPRQNLRALHRPVNRYKIPESVEQPQFDLSFRIAQNRFWGRAKTPSETDFSSPGSVMFEMEQERAFIADYYFHPLFASELSLSNPRVIDLFPEEIPPRILLGDDTANLANLSGRTLPNSAFGLPDRNSDAEYLNIVFSLDTEDTPEAGDSVFLIGDFTGWALRSENRLSYNEDTKRWQTSAIIKEGEYKYKYVMVKENEIDDLIFDPLFERTKQEYYVFVYQQDKNEFYDRLLQVNTVIAGS